jgi:AmmeMemoRadiSam system protein A
VTGWLDTEHLRCVAIDTDAQNLLLDAAWRVIYAGVSTGIRPDLEVGQFPAELQNRRASFITLTLDSKLRGCCGTVEAHQALIKDVADNAWRTAFADSRFEPLREPEYAGLRLEISVLSPLLRIDANDQQQLLSRLEPDHHGLLIRSGNARATFLPKVWDSLPEPEVFLQQLRAKAGMPLDRWPARVEAFVYTAQLFGEKKS